MFGLILSHFFIKLSLFRFLPWNPSSLKTVEVKGNFFTDSRTLLKEDEYPVRILTSTVFISVRPDYTVLLTRIRYTLTTLLGPQCT